MYRYLSVLLAGCLLVLGVFYLIERKSHANSERELTNQIAKLEGTLRETETVSSVRAQEIDDLKLKNGELKKLIESRDEEVAALTQAAISWKGKYLKILNATQHPVDPGGDPVVPDPDCQKCLESVRMRVDFEQVEDYLKVKGFTLTSPPYAEVGITWERDLKLNIILTRDKNKNFRVYVDTNNSDFVPSKLELKVDPSVFESSWYEKILLNGSLHIGDGVMTSVGLGYDILPNWTVGPSFMVGFTDSVKKFYGANILWYPFKR